MNEKTIFAIYRHFESWSANLDFACKKGCAHCCTQNVTITALEAKIIHQFIRIRKEAGYLDKIFEDYNVIHPPTLTSNEFATACLRGENVEEAESRNTSPCPFLEDNCCSIYAVRPFGCRCFGSLSQCSSVKAALLPEYYLSVSTAVLQILEHLGQNEAWGALLDVLLATTEKPVKVRRVNSQPLTAQPLTGFLTPEKDQHQLQNYLNSLFSLPVGEMTLGKMCET